MLDRCTLGTLGVWWIPPEKSSVGVISDQCDTGSLHRFGHLRSVDSARKDWCRCDLRPVTPDLLACRTSATLAASTFSEFSGGLVENSQSLIRPLRPAGRRKNERCLPQARANGRCRSKPSAHLWNFRAVWWKIPSLSYAPFVRRDGVRMRDVSLRPERMDGAGASRRRIFGIFGRFGGKFPVSHTPPSSGGTA